EILDRQRESLRPYEASVLSGTVEALTRNSGCFTAHLRGEGDTSRQIAARRVLLATGAVDVEPDLPDLPNAVQRGLVRYCPICDGYESRERRIAVIGHGERGLGEALFIARTYSDDVTLLTLGCPMELDEKQRAAVAEHRLKLVEQPIEGLDVRDGRIAALRGGGQEHRFDLLYSALGLHYRSDLAVALGAAHDERGALQVDAH